jgi:hypothetical protein
MNFKNSFRLFLLTAALFVIGGCATKYEKDTLTNYVDREKLEDLSAEEISAGSVDMEQMKKDKKLNIGIILTVQDESQGRARIPNAAQFVNDAYALAANYIARVKAYRVVVLPRGAKESNLFTGKEFDGVKYHFFISMHVVMNSEIEERYDYDEAMYKTSIEWKLIDNRTKANGLGKNDAPFVKEALTCKNVTSRKLKLSGIGGGRLGGSNARNAQNAFKNTLENALIEFRAQLANRLPFGGKISALRERDGKVLMTLKAGSNDGITPRMQILIMNEEGILLKKTRSKFIPLRIALGKNAAL